MSTLFLIDNRPPQNYIDVMVSKQPIRLPVALSKNDSEYRFSRPFRHRFYHLHATLGRCG
ncbi:hypothetical protein B2D07_08355 [Desulfococcus multivorans]|nr:hypothetical protein B2D07_08355 [Desulfococcus multivorans]